ncbi:MAG TPA: thioredoxin-disulfide reductase [Rikenellaceae bacterium]|nr:thioredoxin-disulfide reductase [Rikenellaceae bacterium]
MSDKIKCLIIGGGPAGYTAAIYACRAALSPVLVEGPQPGGQLVTTTKIENYPGFENGIDALTLMENMRAQARNLGTTLLSGTVQSCDLAQRTVTLKSGDTIEFQTLIIATGASAKYLGLESEKKFRGMGVSACATCDGFFYRDKSVAVVGGGDSACEEAMYLSGIASRVYMIVRKNYLRASETMKERVAHTSNIEILYDCTTKEILGDAMGVNGVRLTRGNGEIFELKIDGFFLAIGHHPNTEWLGGALALNEEGYIISDGVKTSREGVFVAGDVRDTDFRQAITAAADGCRAALEAEKFIKN